ncbi:MAG: hypothetical protein J6K21_02760 [Bacilli bacterium]|nr:hypothetical protein [Bacilli bacterium]
MQKKIISKQIRKYGTYEEKTRERRKKKEKILNIHNLIDNKKFALALSSIENYINSYSEDCYIIHEYGRYYLKKFDYEKAKYYFSLNIKNNSENKYYSMYSLGEIAIFEYNYDLAIHYFEEIINSKHKDKCYSLLELAKTYILKEKYNESEKLLLNIIANKMPNYTFALGELIELKLTLNNVNEAEYYLDILKSKDNKSNYEFLEGKIELKKGNINKSKMLFEKIENINSPSSINTKIELAKIEYQLYNYDKSLELLEKIENITNYTLVDCVFLFIGNYIALRKKDKALERVNQLSKFGKEYEDNVLYYLGKIELMDKNYDNAIQYFSKISDKKVKTYKSAKLKEIMILIKQEKYKEAYELFKIVSNIKLNIESDNLERMILIYLNKKLNLNIDIKCNHYIEKLIVEYNKEVVIKHISKHKYYDSNKSIHTLFNHGIDIEKIYDFAYNNISEENYIDNNFTDCYILRYNNVGINEKGVYNYLKVVTLPNSKEIITIYPCDNIHINNIIYNEEINTLEKPKIKKISQVDKFNKKYGIS